jgi:hypothetical protein
MYAESGRKGARPLQDTVTYSIADDNAWKNKTQSGKRKRNVLNTMERRLLN